MKILQSDSKKYSLYSILAVIIIITVTIIMSIHFIYGYVERKEIMIDEMKHSSQLTLISLQKNIANYIASYSVQEYDNLIMNEMGHRDIFAIIVEDYNMGKVLGTELYISGKIKGMDETIVDYDPQNANHLEQLAQSHYIDRSDIVVSGEKVGTIAVYSCNYHINAELNKMIVWTILNSIAISLMLIRLLLKPITINHRHLPRSSVVYQD